MKALELSDALRDIANLYDNPDVVFYMFSEWDTYGESVDVDVVGVTTRNKAVLESNSEHFNYDDYPPELIIDMVYVEGGEWVDGKADRD